MSEETEKMILAEIRELRSENKEIKQVLNELKSKNDPLSQEVAEYLNKTKMAARFGKTVRTLDNWIKEQGFPEPNSEGLISVKEATMWLKKRTKSKKTG